MVESPAKRGTSRKTVPMIRYLLGAALGALLAAPALAAMPDIPFTPAQIEAAEFTGTDLPPGRSPLTAKVQVLLDRAGTSPGVTDGFKGAMSRSAIMAFERRMGLPVDGVLDAQVWAALQPSTGGTVTQEYTITEADAADLVQEIPTDYLQKANMIHLGYTSVAERLGERFHMDEKFISFLNPGVPLVPGQTITVVAPGKPARGVVTRIIIDKAARRVAGYDDKGRMLVDYPATIGSDSTPSPSGKVTVTATALNPEYTYNPKVNFTQGQNKSVLTIPPGPNGPVGTVWISLSKPTYGIHGTATPSRLFHNQSFGCVRLTNWDAEELAHMVRAGVTTVEFLEPGVTIADVTEAVTPPADLAVASGPLTRSARPPSRAELPEAAVVALAPEADAPLPTVAQPEGIIAQPDAEAEVATAAPTTVPGPSDRLGPQVVPVAPLPEVAMPADPAPAVADPLAAALRVATQAAPAPVVPQPTTPEQAEPPVPDMATAAVLPAAGMLSVRPTPRPMMVN